jgi:hypothetical protein
MVLGSITPVKAVHVLSLIKFHRRNLHFQNFSKGGVRKSYGGTRSLGLNRGSLVRHSKLGLCTVGGTMKGRVSLHSLKTGKRITQQAKKKDLKILTNLKWRVAFLPGLKAGDSCHKI